MDFAWNLGISPELLKLTLKVLGEISVTEKTLCLTSFFYILIKDAENPGLEDLCFGSVGVNCVLHHEVKKKMKAVQEEE